MTYYDYFSQFPDEHLSRLQAARIYPRHTLRNVLIYREYLALKAEPPNPSRFAQPLGRMDYYTRLADRHAISEDRIRTILRYMERDF